jgi:hypothetical protein
MIDMTRAYSVLRSVSLAPMPVAEHESVGAR